MKEVLVGILKFYKKFISPTLVGLMGNGCRFTPTCSEYTIEAIEKFGAPKGIWLGLKRFGRCHPLGGSGFDPIPAK